MKKTHFTSILLLLLMFAFSCSKDKDTPQEVEEEQEEQIELPTDIPSEFEISLEPSFASVSLEWTVGEGINNEDLVYSIYINDSLVAYPLSFREHTVSDLDFTTQYSLKVVAKNVIGERIVETNFETLNPDDYTILLDSYSYLRNGEMVTYNYIYNEENQIVEMIYDGYDGEDFYISRDYEYDTNGRIIEESERRILYAFISGLSSAYTYIDDRYDEVNFFDSNDISQVGYYHDFTDENNYSLTEISNTKGFPTRYNYFQIELERDGDNRIIKCTRTDLDTQQVKKIIFEYNNGNVTKIIEVPGGVWAEIEYDDKKSYITFDSNIRSEIRMGPGMPAPPPPPPIVFNDNYLYYSIPEFRNYRNKNNPINYRRNGYDRNVSYEYNELGYPTKIIYAGHEDNPRILTYSYILN